MFNLIILRTIVETSYSKSFGMYHDWDDTPLPYAPALVQWIGYIAYFCRV